MSQVYATEPSTSGRVLLETTHGPLEIQLWCRECPLTTRLFLQLCTDGYYDNMSFHRIVPDFLVQTGAVRQPPPASQKTMDAIYREAVHAQEALDRRKYEVHSRLRFNHRGQVAMALGLSDDNDEKELQPQFFITLDEAPYLDGKHVLFGTITGPTMFNALRIGRTDVDESTNQPADMEHAPRVLSVKIVDNPILTDLVPQTHVPWKVKKEETLQKKKKKKRKGKKDLNVLSFGNEMEDDNVDSGMKSSHDVVASEMLSNRVDDKVKEAVTAAGDQLVKKERQEDIVDPEPTASSEKIKVEEEERSATEPAINGNHLEPLSTSSLPAKLPEEDRSQRPPKKSAVESRLAKYKKLKSSTNKKQREEDTMAKLMAFQGKVRKQVTSNRNGNSEGEDPKDDSLASRMARKLQAEPQEPREQASEAQTYRGNILEDSDDDERKDSWLTTKFKCRKHMDLDSAEGADGRTMDDYRVVDEKHGGHRDRKPRKHSSKHRDHGDRRRQRR